MLGVLKLLRPLQIWLYSRCHWWVDYVKNVAGVVTLSYYVRWEIIFVEYWESYLSVWSSKMCYFCFNNAQTTDTAMLFGAHP